jgi:hypothetical protein
LQHDNSFCSIRLFLLILVKYLLHWEDLRNVLLSYGRIRKIDIYETRDNFNISRRFFKIVSNIQTTLIEMRSYLTEFSKSNPNEISTHFFHWIF